MHDPQETIHVAEPVFDGEGMNKPETALQSADRSVIQVPKFSPARLREQMLELVEYRKLLTEFLKNQMVAGFHYYTFSKLGKEQESFDPNAPRDDRPALTQDGSRNIVSLYQCKFGEPIKEKEEFFPDGHYYAQVRVPIYQLGSSEPYCWGVGICTTRESKYAYRKGERTCPNCGEPRINKSKFPPKNAPQGTTPGWYCYARIGGCGAEFEANDSRITEQVVGRVDNPDLADLYNTVYKMAVKRAKVHATNDLPCVSEIFRPALADDLEDKADEVKKSPTAPPAQKRPASSKQQTASQEPPQSTKTESAVQIACNLANKLMKEHSVEFEDLALQFLPEGVGKFEELNELQAVAATPGLAELLTAKIQGK